MCSLFTNRSQEDEYAEESISCARTSDVDVSVFDVGMLVSILYIQNNFERLQQCLSTEQSRRIVREHELDYNFPF